MRSLILSPTRALSPPRAWLPGALALALALASALALVPAIRAKDSDADRASVREDFTGGADAWKTTDPTAWKITEAEDGNRVFELTKKRSAYEPPHRSPLNIALYQPSAFGAFTLEARVKTTHESYGHRDLCFFFGYQDPAHFYYVHLGQETDDHANQIFIVDGADRTKISSKTTEGTPWKDGAWHDVKIVRDPASGVIKVFFDDMEKPVMEASDRTFGPGLVGIGSFDDTGMWDDIRLTGERLSPQPGN